MEMAHEHGATLGHGEVHHGPRTLPTVLTAPEFVGRWRTRAGIISAVFALLSLAFLAVPGGKDHLLRAYLMGYMTCFNLCGGALAFLMVQYVSGGKWGLILRRPLEAMTRTIWVVIALFIPVLFFMKHLYLWAAYTTPAETLKAYHDGLITNEQHLDIDYRHVMLRPGPGDYPGCNLLCVRRADHHPAEQVVNGSRSRPHGGYDGKQREVARAI